MMKKLLLAGVLLLALTAGVARSDSIFNGFTLEWSNFGIGSGGVPRKLLAGGGNQVLSLGTSDENGHQLLYSASLTLAGNQLSGVFDVLADKPSASGMTYTYGLSLRTLYQPDPNGSATRTYGGYYRYQYAPVGTQAVDQTSGSSAPLQFVPDHDTLDLCSIRVHVAEACDAPAGLKLEGGYGYFDSGNLDTSTTDPALANGFIASQPSAGNYVVTGEFLAKPAASIPVSGTLYFQTDTPVGFSGTAVTSNGPSGCTADVDVSVTTCGVPESPVRATGSIRINPPQTGCDLVVGGATLYSGCPRLNYSVVMFDNVHDVNDTLADPASGVVHSYQYTTATDGVTAQYDTQTPGYSITPIYAGLSSTQSGYYGPTSAYLNAADGRNASFYLDTVQSATQGWWPAFTPDSAAAGSEGTGVLQNGTFVLRKDKPNVFNYTADTGVMQGQLRFEGCATPADLALANNGYYYSNGSSYNAADTHTGTFTIPDYYAPTFAARPDEWRSELAAGSNPLAGYIETGISHAAFVSTLDPLQTGYYQVLGLVGPYSDSQLGVTFSRTAPADFLNESLNVVFNHPGSYTLSSTARVQRDLPVVALGRVNVRLQAFQNGQPVLFKNAAVEGFGGGVTDPVLADGSSGFFNALGPSEQLATQQIVRVVAPSYSSIFTENPNGGSGITAELPFNGGYVRTNFPDIPAIALPPPAADGSCQAVCTNPSDPAHAVYIDDEKPPVVSYPAPLSGTLQAGVVTLTATVTDSAPVDSVTVDSGAAATPTISYPTPLTNPVISTLQIPLTIGCGPGTANVIAITDKCGQIATPISIHYAGVDNFTPSLPAATGAAPAGQAFSATLAGALSPVNNPAAVANAGTVVNPLTYALTSVTRKDANAGAPQDVTAALGSTFDPATHSVSWTPDPADFVGAKVPSTVVYSFTLKDACKTTTGTLTLTVTNNAPPSLSVTSPVNGAEGTALTIPLNGSDPDVGDSVAYSCTGLPAGMTPSIGFDAATSSANSLVWTPSYSQHGTYTLHCWVTDSHGLHDDDGAGACSGPGSGPDYADDGSGLCGKDIVVHIARTNVAPLVYNLSDAPYRVAEGATLSVQMQGFDANSDTLTWSLPGAPPNMTINPSTGAFTFTPDYTQASPLNYVVAITATDNDPIAPLSGHWNARILVSNVNRPPVLQAVAAQTVAETQTLSFAVTGSDPDMPVTGVNPTVSDSITVTMSQLPFGASYSSGTFSWTPGYQTHGSYTVLARVTDAAGLYDEKPISIVVTKTNLAPVLTAVADRILPENSQVSFSLAATDGNADALTFSSPNLPPGAALDASTGVFTWTPDFTEAATWPITLNVSDGALTSSVVTHITVTNVNRLPVIDAIAPHTVAETQALSFTVTGSDADVALTQRNPNLGDTLTWSASGLPAGAVFNAATATFAWTPGYNDAGDHAVVFTLADDKGGSDSKVGLIHVTNTNRPPQLVSVPVQNGIENQLLTFSLAVTDPDGDAVACTMSGLPSGASYDDASRKFSWTPPFDQLAEDVTVFHVGIRCCDASSCATQAAEIDVAEVDRAPVLDAVAEVTVKVQTPVTMVVQGHDPDNESALTYSASDLPQGASFDPMSRTLSWTPLENQGGDYTVHFSVSDGQFSATQPGLIHVLPPNYTRLGGGFATRGCSTAGGSLWPLLGALALLFRRRSR